MILFNVLRTKCAWERRRPSNSAVPRDEAYYRDLGTKYSRREYKPLAWLPELLSLKIWVEAATPAVAYSSLNLPRLAITPYSVIFSGTETC